MDKVLGIGNALVDIMTKLPDDSTLDKFSLRKGSMQLSERDFADKINKTTLSGLPDSNASENLHNKTNFRNNVKNPLSILKSCLE